MINLIHRYFGAGWLGRVMVCIARAESGLNPRAYNRADWYGGSYGLMQVNAIWRHRGESVRAFEVRMRNPYVNLSTARDIYRRQGIRAWATASRCT